MNPIKYIKDKFTDEKDIGEPPYSYGLLSSLDKKEYPKYLKKIFLYETGEKLDLKNPKTINQKIQWIKLYDATPIKTQLTDKVLAREYVRNKIGEEYLKPVLQICKTFDDINFENFPQSFIIKTNHGCKWQYIIKKKDSFLKDETLHAFVRNRVTNWLSDTFAFWAGFEMQYLDIEPQIIIEPILRDDVNEKDFEIEIYCFNGCPKLFSKIKYGDIREACVYDENYNTVNLRMMPYYKLVEIPVDDILKKAVELSKILANDFNLVRVDWLVNNSKLYFNELTFTPFSGYFNFDDKSWNLKLGKMLKLK